MSKQAMYELREILCKELDEIARKGELGTGDLEIVHKLTDTIKNIDKIDALEDDGYSGRYSRDGDWEADIRGTYGRGSSYARRGTHYVRGHYSRTDAREHMREKLEDMMRDANDDTTRDAIRRCMEQIDRA